MFAALVRSMKNLIFALFLFSSQATANSFTYDIQKAGYRFDQYDLMGKATIEKFRATFRNYPWKDQVGKSNGGSEPTISVKKSNTKDSLWVSAIGSSEDYIYVVGIVQPKKIKNVLGVETEVSWVSAYLFQNAEWVEEAFELYFQGKTDVLNSKLADLSIFFEQEAAN